MPNVVTVTDRENDGSNSNIFGVLNFTGTYDNVAKEVIQAVDLGMATIQRIVINFYQGITYDVQIAADQRSAEISLYTLILNGAENSVTQLPSTSSIQPDSHRIYLFSHTVTGPFSVGETVTGSISTSTATVNGYNNNPSSLYGDYVEIDYAGASGLFDINETITGSVSLNTATVESGIVGVYSPFYNDSFDVSTVSFMQETAPNYQAFNRYKINKFATFDAGLSNQYKYDDINREVVSQIETTSILNVNTPINTQELVATFVQPTPLYTELPNGFPISIFTNLEIKVEGK